MATGSQGASSPRKKVTILDLSSKKRQADPITMLTAYDYSSAQLVDQAGVDLILVGDSLAMVMMGLETTVPVTMEEMLHHCRAVARGAHGAYLVGDMPFMSYQASASEAVQNAGRFLKEGRMDAIKLEGGREVASTVQAIVDAGIPTMGHIGLTPQSVSQLGGYRVQGRTASQASRLLHDAFALEEAGCFSLVLEAVPAPVAQAISERLKIPTIGIGAGAGCDGQVLVYHDLLGLFDRFTPKFVKQYAVLSSVIREALNAFVEDVSERRFPSEAHTYAMDDDELQAFLQEVANLEE
ncbi:MAG: 3-methyl-2-oxobutanoate hydroxymethyltransferase [Candidatus Promineifilaceae bacterium]|nr:3-methyl-2-oxobutanoate hydroxymethyltransferase [Candidatus Promineifilaceae bacterium]